MSTDAAAPPPTVLAGRYRLERRVAQGGMAEVWLATDTALSRQVAVKLLKPQLAADPVVAERFRREAIAVASVTHPNIVAVYDAVEDNGRQAVVMQYVQGKTLRQLLDEQGKLSPELTVHIGSALASALDAAHAAGLVHRDVKPGNVLVTPDGRVQLADFGIAKALGSGDDLTSDNVMMGTAKYLSPEQVRGRKLDGRADLYSLGLVLYECLAGRVPFLGETDADTALARLQRDATDLTRLRPTLPRNLASVVHRLMEREPEHRYPTGASVRAALGTALASPPADPWTPSAPRSGPVTVFDDDLLDDDSHDDRAAAGGRTPTAQNPVLFDAAVHDPTSEAARATGSVPVVDDDATRAARLDPILSTMRDRTPTGVPPARPPAPRGMQQRWTPSLVVMGVLLLLALIVGLVVWSSIGERGAADDVDTPNPAVDPTSGAESVVAGPGTSEPGDTGDTGGSGTRSPGIAAISSFDPDGSDNEENESEAENAVDGDPDTTWNTVCYESPYFGGKRGIGLVVGFDTATSGVLGIDVASGPWIVHVYGTDGAAPAELEAWGDPIAQDFGNEPETMSVDLEGRSVQHVLVLMKQGAENEACSEANPNRGSIAEISIGSR
jgi:serine/threonine-protein kinase